MRNHARILAVALALSASGCSLMVDPAKNDPLASAEGFCNSMQDVFDRFVARCEGVDPAYASALISQLRPGCANAGTAEGQGRIGYDKALAEQCIATFDALTCNEEVWQTFQFCALALPGLVPEGGTCTSPYSMINECAGNGTCYVATTCPGTCVLPGGVGEACAPAGPVCAPGLVCDSGNVCRVPGGWGDACGGSNPPCNDSYYYCDTSLTPPACRNLPSGNGAACGSTFGYQCYSGYACVYDASVAAYVCRPPAAHGGDCSWPATHYTCVATDYCRYDSSAASGYKCWTIPAGPQPEGGDCGNGGTSLCQAGLFCDWNQNETCQPYLAAGASCTDSGPCGPRAVCSKLDSESTGTCKALKTQGSQCRAGARECLEGLWCDGPSAGSPGVCRPLGGTGAPCGNPYYTVGPPAAQNEKVDCAVGYYCHVPSGLQAGTCNPSVGAGGSCLVGSALDYDACGGFFFGAYCDSDATSLTYGTCVANACFKMLGWFPGMG